MRHIIAKLAVFGACAVCSVGMTACSADIHDNTLDVHDNNANIDNAKVELDTDVDTDNVQPSQSVHLNIKAEDVFLIEPSAQPPPDRVKVAGHFQIYFDNTSGAPLLVTAQESVNVTIPPTATPGDHKLICRVHKHDGTATSASFELSIKVNAKVTATATTGT